MKHLAIAGLINIETTLKVDAFPVAYEPARFPYFGVNTTVSGVGYNLTKALHTLGHRVHFLSIVGADANGELARTSLADLGIETSHIHAAMPHTAQSVILYDPTGKRAIYTDLKDIQERAFPLDVSDQLLPRCDLALICNINFARPMLAQARAAGLPIATDVHAIGAIDDDYNRDFMAAAHILFQSHENLPCTPEEWLRELWARYQTPLAVVGLGEQGALLAVYDDQAITHVPAVYTRPVVSTIGAGDALFSAFVHTYLQTPDPLAALRKAVVYASYKIGVVGAADGFLTAAEFDRWAASVSPPTA